MGLRLSIYDSPRKAYRGVMIGQEFIELEDFGSSYIILNHNDALVKVVAGETQTMGDRISIKFLELDTSKKYVEFKLEVQAPRNLGITTGSRLLKKQQSKRS